MAKTYQRGDDYRLYLNIGTQVGPVWARISAVADLSVDPAPADVAYPEQGISDGHLQGHGDPAITFTLFENTGDANVATLITAMNNGTMKEIAISTADLVLVPDALHYRLEAAFVGQPLNVAKGEPAAWDVEARRHANSDFGLRRILPP